MKYYTINMDSHNNPSGVEVEFFQIIEHKNLGFKCYYGKNPKTNAIFAWKNQKKLNKLGLAPKVYGRVKKIRALINNEFKSSPWGFITEIAITKKYNSKSKLFKKKEINNLIKEIKQKTGLIFVDSHEENVGYINIKKKKKLVCIDTGIDSFYNNDKYDFKKS